MKVAIIAILLFLSSTYLQNTTAATIAPSADAPANTAQTTSTQGTLMPTSVAERRLELANRWYLGAVFVAAGFGFVGIIASFAIYYYSKDVSAEQAKIIEKLRNDLAANEVRSAELQLEIERTKASSAELMRLVAWRQITPDQATELANVLEGKLHKFTLRCVPSDPEALAYCVLFQKIMEQLDSLEVTLMPMQTQGWSGISVVGPPGPQRDILLNAAKILSDAAYAKDGKQLEILIGSKIQEIHIPIRRKQQDH